MSYRSFVATTAAAFLLAGCGGLAASPAEELAQDACALYTDHADDVAALDDTDDPAAQMERMADLEAWQTFWAQEFTPRLQEAEITITEFGELLAAECPELDANLTPLVGD